MRRLGRTDEWYVIGVITGICAALLALSLFGCATDGVTSTPPRPAQPTPTTITQTVQQPYPPVTVIEQPDCGVPAEAADSNGKLNWLGRCLGLMTQWGQDQHHELEAVNAARITPTPAPGG